MKRVLTALVLIPFALYSIYWAPHWIFVGIVFAMAALCYHEFAGLADASGVKGPLWVGFVAGAIAMWRPDAISLIVLTLLTLSLSLRDLRSSIGFAGAVLLGVVYVFLAWRSAMELHGTPHWILFALAINWVGDIAAFYVGRRIGRHKLAPRISPGKSWEGSVASLIAAILFGIAFAYRFYPGLPIVYVAALSFGANAAGQVGDLAESAMKRGAGLKDSGTLLPGHGGFLDRLDSSLFTLPFVYYWVLWFGW